MSVHEDPLLTFRDEAVELVAEFEEALLVLDEDPDNSEEISRAFRCLHTIKGSAAMFEMNHLVQFAHALEAAFSRVRDGNARVTAALITAGLSAKDVLQALVANNGDPTGLETAINAVLSGLAGGGFESEHPPASASPAAKPSSSDRRRPRPAVHPDATIDEATPKERGDEDEPDDDQELTSFRIRVHPSSDAFLTGSDPLLLLRDIKELGEAVVIGSVTRVPPIEEIAPEDCYLDWDVLLTTAYGEDAVRDVFIFVEMVWDVSIESIVDSAGDDLDFARIGRILVDRGDLTDGELDDALASRRRLGEMLVERGLLTPAALAAALAEQALRRESATRPSGSYGEQERQLFDRLRRIPALVGEFSFLQAGLRRVLEHVADDDLSGIGSRFDDLMAELRHLSDELQSVAASILLSPIADTIRRAFATAGREIDVVLRGAETEIDRDLAPVFSGPFARFVDHLVRDTEMFASQDIVSVTVGVERMGTSVRVFVVSDLVGDVSARGVDRSLRAQSTIDDVELKRLGASVVEIEGGFIATLPMSFSSIEGLLAQTEDTVFLVPLDRIMECIDLDTFGASAQSGVARYRDRVLPLINLRRFFSLDGEDPDNPYAIVVTDGVREVGLVVDKIDDTYQGAVKSLGGLYGDTPGISGAVLLGDGSLALVLHTVSLVAHGEQESLRDHARRAVVFQ